MHAKCIAHRFLNFFPFTLYKLLEALLAAWPHFISIVLLISLYFMDEKDSGAEAKLLSGNDKPMDKFYKQRSDSMKAVFLEDSSAGDL